MIEISTYELGDVSRVCHFHFKESEKLYHFEGWSENRQMKQEVWELLL